MLTKLRNLFRWLMVSPEQEPPGLFRLFGVGVLVIVIGTSLAALVGTRQGLWKFETPLGIESWEKRWKICGRQYDYLSSRKSELREKQAFSARRLEGFKAAALDPHNPAFVVAPVEIKAEESRGREIKRELESLEVESIRKFLPNLVIGLLLVILFALVAARLITRHGLSAVGRKWSRSTEAEGWRLPYWLIVAFVFIVHSAREVFTSILTVEKSWVVWSSFCVSSWAWALMLVPALGFAMVVAYPATVLWHFGRDSHRPRELNGNHVDGHWGAGQYVAFLHTWSHLSLAFIALPGALWLKAYQDDPHFTLPYLLTTAAVVASGLVITARFIISAIRLRKAYKRALNKLGKTWQEIQKQGLPPDPTIGVLGESWWKLPVVVSGIFTLSWLIANQVGVGDFLKRLVGVE